MTSDAEFRMLMMLNTMDLNQEGGHLSSEDRLFMAPTNQQQQSQVRSRIGASRGHVCCHVPTFIVTCPGFIHYASQR